MRWIAVYNDISVEQTTSDRAISAINGDMAKRVVMAADTMQWQPSPSGTVWRKRLHLVGGAESGQVTSIVRYEKGSTFPAHDHPDGEEILVLDGVFSDEHGDWPAGSYLLNPEGFRHAPFSKDGCMIFVKLKQYSGPGRHHVALCTDPVEWEESCHPGIYTKKLYSESSFPDHMRLERWNAGTSRGTATYEGGVEILVLQGTLWDERGRYSRLTWLCLPPGAAHAPVSPNGCEIFIKEGALPTLSNAPPW